MTPGLQERKRNFLGEEHGIHWVRRSLLVADIVESVRLIEEYPADTIHRWSRFMRVVDSELLPRHHGVMVKSLGDGMLMGFESACDAVACGLALQPLLSTFNVGLPSDQAIWLRCGVHLGEVAPTEFDWYGTPVNLAARLATLAEPGGCVASVDVCDALTPDLDAEFEDLGNCYLKHVAEPIRCSRVRPAQTRRVVLSSAPSAVEDLTRLVIAVIPLDPTQDLHASPEHQSIGDALADGLISAFSKRRDWKVQSRLSTAALRNRAKHWAGLHDTLGATHLVCGSFNVKQEHLEVQIELHDVRRRSKLWENHFEVQLDDYFAGYSRFVPEVLDAVTRAVTLHEQRCAHALPLPTLDTYSLHLGGTTLMHRLSATDFKRSHALLEQLRDRAPRAASPHASLAKWHLLCMAQGWSQDRVSQAIEARTAAKRALQLNPDHPYALSVDAQTNVHTTGNLELARLGYLRAIEVDPHEPASWYLLSGLHAYCDEGELAVAAAERAIELSPLDPLRFFMDAYLSMALLSAGRYDASIAAGESALRRNSCLSSGYRTLAVALVFSGREEEARLAIQKLLAAEPHSTLRSYQQNYPGRNSAHMPSYVAALRIAGMPE